MVSKELLEAWNKFLDSKDYASHDLARHDFEGALSWALRTRKELTEFIELLESGVRASRMGT